MRLDNVHSVFTCEKNRTLLSLLASRTWHREISCFQRSKEDWTKRKPLGVSPHMFPRNLEVKEDFHRRYAFLTGITAEVAVTIKKRNTLEATLAQAISLIRARQVKTMFISCTKRSSKINGSGAINTPSQRRLYDDKVTIWKVGELTPVNQSLIDYCSSRFWFRMI